MALLRRAGSPSPNTSGRLRLSSVSIPLTSTPTDGGTLFLLAGWFIGALLLCAAMIWLPAQPAKQKQLKVIVSVFWWMGRWLAGTRCPSAICGYLAHRQRPHPMAAFGG